MRNSASQLRKTVLFFEYWYEKIRKTMYFILDKKSPQWDYIAAKNIEKHHSTDLIFAISCICCALIF